MREINLSQGKIALVDDEDYYSLLSAGQIWSSYRNHRIFYAVRAIRRPDGRRTTEKMHRAIYALMLGRPLLTGEKVIHVDKDGLNNQRSNLRLRTS
jgi:hypothetical protein